MRREREEHRGLRVTFGLIDAGRMIRKRVGQMKENATEEER